MQLQPPENFQAILANAKTLRPFLVEKSASIEVARRLPDDVVEALIDGGLFRMNMPRSWSGPELTSMEQVEVVEQISRGDASAGWCVVTGCDSGVYAGYLDDEVARNLYPHLDMIQAGWVYPIGRADEIDGGYEVSGQWSFCSGSGHADLVVAGCTVYRNGQPLIGAAGLPEWRLVLAPKSHWKMEDNWHTTGLKGTASVDYTTMETSMLIPKAHTFSFLEPKREGTLWRQPDTILRKMSGVPLGLARRLIDDTTDMIRTRKDRLGVRSYQDNSHVKSAIAEAEMMLGSARSYVYAALEDQWRSLEADQPLSVKQRSDVWLSRFNAFQRAYDIARLLYDTVGAQAIYTGKTSLDRGLRDAATMCQHIVGQRREMEKVGGLLLGVEQGAISPML